MAAQSWSSLLLVAAMVSELQLQSFEQLYLNIGIV